MHEHTHTPHHHEHDHTSEHYEHEGHSHDHHTHDAREVLHHDCDHTHPGECSSLCGCSHEHASSHAHDLFNSVPSHGEVGHHCTSTCETHHHEADSAADVLFDTQPKHGEAGHTCHTECSTDTADVSADKLFTSPSEVGASSSHGSLESKSTVTASDIAATHAAKDVLAQRKSPQQQPLVQQKQHIHTPPEQVKKRIDSVPRISPPTIAQRVSRAVDTRREPVLPTTIAKLESTKPANPEIPVVPFIHEESKPLDAETPVVIVEDFPSDYEVESANTLEIVAPQDVQIEQPIPTQPSLDYIDIRELEMQQPTGEVVSDVLEISPQPDLQDMNIRPTIEQGIEPHTDNTAHEQSYEYAEMASDIETVEQFADYASSFDPMNLPTLEHSSPDATPTDFFLDESVQSLHNTLPPLPLLETYDEVAPLLFEEHTEKSYFTETLEKHHPQLPKTITREHAADPEVVPIETQHALRHLVALIQSAASPTDIRDVSILVTAQLGAHPSQVRELFELTTEYRPTARSHVAASEVLQNIARLHIHREQPKPAPMRFHHRIVLRMKRHLRRVWKRINYTLPLADIAKLY